MSEKTNSQQKTSDQPLHGMKSITGYMGKSETTILKLIRFESFPASKICGEWVSDVELIKKWRQDKIQKGF